MNNNEYYRRLWMRYVEYRYHMGLKDEYISHDADYFHLCLNMMRQYNEFQTLPEMEIGLTLRGY